MATTTSKQDIGIVKVRIERRGTFPNGVAIYHGRIIGRNSGVTTDDTLGGDTRQVVAEVAGLLSERGLTGSVRVVA